MHKRLSATLALGAALGAFAACSGPQAGGGAGGYTGTVTLENRSSVSICRLEWDGSERFNADVRVDPGSSTTFTIASSSGKLFLTECGGGRTVWGSQGSVGYPGQMINDLSTSTIALYDQGASETRGGETAIEVNPVEWRDWIPSIYQGGMNDRALSQQMLDGVISYASSQGWYEEFRSGFNAQADWTVYRNEWTSVITHRATNVAAMAQWPDGHCTLQQFGFQQQHDGWDFNGPITYAGVGPQWQVPCGFLDWVATQPNVAAYGGSDANLGSGGGGAVSAPATPSPAPTGGGGGMCENTCGTSFDNECDDGGPGSLYSICPLGTDCNDCGPR